MKRPKICIVFCGGTIAMTRNTEGYLEPFFSAQQLIETVPEINQIADVDLVQVVNIDSTNIQPHHWIKIAEVIHSRYTAYDGFVITHGTDTMVYTAVALSFALQNLDKPIVLTGSQKPLDDTASDAKNNLVNACKVASMNLAEVSIVFGSMILRGNRAKKKSEVMLDAFWSPVALPIGRIHLEPMLINSHMKREKRALRYSAAFNPNVGVYEIIPGMNPKYLVNDLKDGIEGVVLSAPGAGNVPHLENSLIPFIEKARSSNIPIVVTTQCLEGSAQMSLYEAGTLALKAGAVSGGDMTHEAATVKLMWGLAQNKQRDEIQKLFETNIVGEVTLHE